MPHANILSRAFCALLLLSAGVASAAPSHADAPTPEFSRDGWREKVPALPLDAVSLTDMQTLSRADAQQVLPAWSRTVWQQAANNNWEIFVGDGLFGGTVNQLTNNDTTDVHPRLNYGATRIVFASNRTGAFKIFIFSRTLVTFVLVLSRMLRLVRPL